jgi:hypothetical protein
MWKVSALADVDLDTLISSPNGIIITDQMDGVEPLMTPDVTGNAYNEAAAIQADIEDAVVPRSVQGAPESGKLGRTARGAAMIIAQAMEKFSTIIKLSEEMGIKRVLRMFHQLNLQFLDEDEYFTDKGFYGGLFERAILPEDIRAEVRFQMAAMSDMVNKEGKINQIVSFMGVFGKVLSPDSISTLAKKVWTLMGFNPDDVTLQGMQAPAGVENIVDGNLTSAILGQAQNQGVQGTPSVPPQGAKQ